MASREGLTDHAVECCDNAKYSTFCLCMCSKCYAVDASGDTSCICLGCECTRQNTMVKPAKPVEIVQLPQPVDKPAHVCDDCGTEVFRNGTRGRFPKRCPDCKKK